MSQLMSEGVAGSAVYSTQGQTLINAGLGDLTDQMNQLGSSIKNGGASLDDEVNMVENFKNRIGSSMGDLQRLALQGSSEAKELIEMYGDLNQLNTAQLHEKLKEQASQQKFTKFMMSLESIWGRLIGKFKEGFMTTMEGFLNKMGDITESPYIDKLAEFFGQLGGALATLIIKVLTPENIERFSTFVGEVANWVTTVGPGLVDKGSALMKMLGALATGGGIVLGAVLSFSNGLLRVMNTFPNLSKWAIEAYLGLKLFKGVTSVFSPLFSMFRSKSMSSFGAQTVNVQAGVVNVNGGGGGILGDMLGGGGKGGFKRGMFSKLKRMTKAGGARGLLRGVSGMFKGGGASKLGALGKIGKYAKFAKFGKMIPFLGSIIAGGSMINNIMQGDWGNAAANGLEMIPGYGTAMGIGDLALTATTGNSIGDYFNKAGSAVFGGKHAAAASAAAAGLNPSDIPAMPAMTDVPSVDDPTKIMKDMLEESKEMKDKMEYLLANMLAVQKNTLAALRKIEVNTQSL
jgi:hypothetical protein